MILDYIVTLKLKKKKSRIDAYGFYWLRRRQIHINI